MVVVLGFCSQQPLKKNLHHNTDAALWYAWCCSALSPHFFPLHPPPLRVVPPPPLRPRHAHTLVHWSQVITHLLQQSQEVILHSDACLPRDLSLLKEWMLPTHCTKLQAHRPWTGTASHNF